MKFTKILTTTLCIGFCGLTTLAQSIVEINVDQNPVFEVSTNVVNATFPEDGGTMTLGADLVITGGSGNYAYRWYTPEGVELGNESTISVENEGAYKLDVTDECDCLQTVEFNVSTASVNDIRANVFHITPNPAESIVEFGGIQAEQMALTSMNGQLAAVISASGATFDKADVSFLAPGTYIVTLTDALGKIYTSKLIKK